MLEIIIHWNIIGCNVKHQSKKYTYKNLRMYWIIKRHNPDEIASHLMSTEKNIPHRVYIHITDIEMHNIFQFTTLST